MRGVDMKSAKITLIGVLLILGGSTTAVAQTSEMDLNIASYLNAEGLTTADVLGIATVVASSEGSWKNGHSMDVKPGYFVISPVGSVSGKAESSLLIGYNPILIQPVGVQSCRPKSTCVPVTVDAGTDGIVEFSVDGIRWHLTVYPAPCTIGLSCQFRIASWALDSRRQTRSASMQSFPDIATIIHHTNGLAIFNAQNGKLWFDQSIPSELNGTGRLRSAQITPEGRLVINFENGSLLFDFERDFLLYGDNNSLSLSDTGIAGFSQAGFSNLVIKPAGDPPTSGKLQLLSDGVAIWGNGHAAINLQNVNLTSLAPIFVSSSENILHAGISFANGRSIINIVSSADSQITLSRYDSASNQITALSVPVSGDPLPSANSLYLVGSGVMQIKSDGAKLLEDNAVKSTSLSMANRSIRLLDDGSAFAQDARLDGCQWIHYQQHRGSPASFKESGMTSSCGDADSFSSSATAVSISSRSGSVIKVHVQRR